MRISDEYAAFLMHTAPTKSENRCPTYFYMGHLGFVSYHQKDSIQKKCEEECFSRVRMQ